MRGLIFIIGILLADVGSATTVLFECSVWGRFMPVDFGAVRHLEITIHTDENQITIIPRLVLRDGNKKALESFSNNYNGGPYRSAGFTGESIFGANCDDDFPRTCFTTLSVNSEEREYYDAGMATLLKHWEGSYKESSNGGLSLDIGDCRER